MLYHFVRAGMRVSVKRVPGKIGKGHCYGGSRGGQAEYHNRPIDTYYWS